METAMATDTERWKSGISWCCCEFFCTNFSVETSEVGLVGPENKIGFIWVRTIVERRNARNTMKKG